jgi:hypothetical protein
MGTIKIRCILKENEGEEVKKEAEHKNFEATKEKELARETNVGLKSKTCNYGSRRIKYCPMWHHGSC